MFDHQRLSLVKILLLFQAISEFSCIESPGDTSEQSLGKATNFEIRMPGITTSKEDEYLCKAWRIPDEKELYAVDFQALAEGSKLHHIILAGCEDVAETKTFWRDCYSECTTNPSIMYAWGRNAPPTHLPKNVGFPVGKSTGLKYLVIQMHYRMPTGGNEPDNSGVRVTITTQAPTYFAGVFLMMKNNLEIPAHKVKVHGDVSCQYDDTADLHIFAFRPHAHTLGVVISGYHVNSSWNLIGKGNPQWPQAFWKVEDKITVKKDDYLVARCTFSSMNKDIDTKIGHTHNDEMCNFYIMYYRDPNKGRSFYVCGENEKKWLFENIPKDSDVPLPPNPELDSLAEGHSHHDHGEYSISDFRPIENSNSYEIRMPGITTSKEDEYLCKAWKIPAEKELYVVDFEALAEGSKLHHIILAGCEDVAETEIFWRDCFNECKGSPSIMYAWGRNAPPTDLPKDVGFSVGKSTGLKYLVIQMHYRMPTGRNEPDNSGVRVTLTTLTQTYIAGVYLMLRNNLEIPAHSEKVHGDVSCQYNDNADLHIFAFRPHAHTLGVVISGYHVNSSWNLIGKGNPQWPQAFWKVEDKITLKKDDYLVARCTFSSMNKNIDTKIGHTHNDEMCNFYIMYYREPSKGQSFYMCNGNLVPSLFDDIPVDSDVPLPPNPEMDDLAEGHSHHDPEDHNHRGMTDHMKTDVSDWPKDFNKIEFGQISGVATDSEGNVYMFHRGKTVWDAHSFDDKNIFKQIKNGPITAKTVVQFNGASGDRVNSWGENLFYMPHGFHIDQEGNFWVTDVAMHQIFKYHSSWFANSSMQPIITLGVKFQPGSDSRHFCKPTDIAVLSNGEFFVSDGYCNSRILKYDKDGALMKEWSTVYQRSSSGYNLPHSITVVDSSYVCVADRENARILCYDLNGSVAREILHTEFQPKLFALTYNPATKSLYAVNGESKMADMMMGFTLDITSWEIVNKWKPEMTNSFSSPHDVAVSPNGSYIYVIEIGPNKIWRISNSLFVSANHLSVKKGGVLNKHPFSSGGEDDRADAKDEAVVEKEQENTGFVTASVLIGGLLIIPLVIVIFVTIYLRLRKRGKLCKPKENRRLNIGQMFSRHKGFTLLKSKELPGDSGELRHLESDSEAEELFSEARPLTA